MKILLVKARHQKCHPGENSKSTSVELLQRQSTSYTEAVEICGSRDLSCSLTAAGSS